MTLTELNDRVEIEELTHLYASHLDTFELESLVDLFTDDAVFDETSVLGGQPIEGIENLRAFYRRGATDMASMVHIMCNFILESLTATHAVAISTMQFEGRAKSKETIRIQGYWRDRFRKVKGRWKIQARKLVLLAPIVRM
jgi:ketosteroid isomerase-like protein